MESKEWLWLGAGMVPCGELCARGGVCRGHGCTDF